MKKNKIAFLVSLFNIISVGIILGDSFLPAQKGEQQTITDKTIEETRGRKAGHYSTYFIYDGNNIKYKVPHAYYDSYAVEDSIFVYRSIFFKKAVIIDFIKDGKQSKVKIGVINGSLFGIIFCIFTITLSVLYLSNIEIIKGRKVDPTIAILSIWLSLIIIAFYFIFQS